MTPRIVLICLALFLLVSRVADSYNLLAQTGLSPNYNWKSIVTSADGNLVVTAASTGPIAVSKNGGLTWQFGWGAPSLIWTSLAASANGQYLAAIAQKPPGGSSSTGLYTSTNGGLNWTQNAASQGLPLTNIVSSTDGSKLVASVAGVGGLGGNYLRTSTNYGVSWKTQPNSGLLNYEALCSSANGVNIAAGVHAGSIRTSYNSGVNWTTHSNTNSTDWFSIACSKDFRRVVALSDSFVYLSSDFGNTFSPLTNLSPDKFKSLSCSGDCKVITVVGSGNIHLSGDYGATWNTTMTSSISATGSASTLWASTAMSHDGTKIYVSSASASSGSGTGGVFTLGPWVDYHAENSATFKGITVSADGKHIVAAASGPANVVASNDGGNTWAMWASSKNWNAVASSRDGTKIIVLSSTDSLALVSVNSGLTYTVTNTVTTGQWTGFAKGVACASDFSRIYAVINPGQIYSSTDGGQTLTALTSSRSITGSCIATSSNGMFVVAGAAPGLIYTSYNGGASWGNRTVSGSEISNPTLNQWLSVACSTDGSRVAASMYQGSLKYLYLSSDGARTWKIATGAPSGYQWSSMTMSSDGSQMAVATNPGYIYTTSNYGVAWTQQTQAGSKAWTGLASAPDFSTLVAVPNNGEVIVFNKPIAATAASVALSVKGIWVDVGINSFWQALKCVTPDCLLLFGMSSASNAALASLSLLTVSLTQGGSLNQKRVDYGGDMPKFLPYLGGGGQWSCIATAPASSIIFAASSPGDIYSSASQGLSWDDLTQAAVSSSSPGPNVKWNALAVSPDASLILAAGYPSNSLGNLLYTSLDKGLTWAAQTCDGATRSLYANCASAPPAGTNNSVLIGYTWSTLAVSPNNKVCFAFGASSAGIYGIFRSTNRGTTWSCSTSKTKNVFFHNLPSIFEMFFSPDGSRFFVSSSHGIAVSIDAGSTYRFLTSPIAAQTTFGFYDFSTAVSSSGSSIITCLTGDLSNSADPCYMSLDSGTTWASMSITSTSVNEDWNVAVMSTDGSMALIGGANSDLFLWNACQPGYFALNATNCIMSPAGAFTSTFMGSGVSAMVGAKGYTNCDAGYYSAPGSTSSLACLLVTPGYFSSMGMNTGVSTPPSGGASGFSACPAGTSNSVYGASTLTACLPCVSGWFSVAGSASCTPCPTGYVATSSSAGSCTLVSPGSYAGGLSPVVDALSSAARSTLVVALSTNLVNNNYTGPIFTLRRSSDSVTQDFYADNVGNLGNAPLASGASLSSWIGSSPVSPLDQISSSAQSSMQLALSCYLLSAIYSGPVLNIRRSSDSTTADFYADASGNLGTNQGATGRSLLTFLDGSVPFVTIWYDQSGSGNHATQPLSTLQPIYNMTNKYLDFCSNASMVLAPSSLPTGNSKYSFVTRFSKPTWSSGYVFGQGSDNQLKNMLALRVSGKTGSIFDSWGTKQAKLTSLIFSAYEASVGMFEKSTVISSTYDLFARRGYQNGALISATTSNYRNGLASPGALGSSPSGNSNLNGKIYSFFSSNMVLSNADRGILEGAPSVYVARWFDQSNHKMHAMQLDPTLQPKYIPGQKLLDFSLNKFMTLSAGTIVPQSPYSFVVKHGAVVTSPLGNCAPFFFQGLDNTANNKVTSCSNGASYVDGNGNAFGNSVTGNVVSEVYNFTARSDYVNGAFMDSTSTAQSQLVFPSTPAYLGRTPSSLSAFLSSIEMYHFFSFRSALRSYDRNIVENSQVATSSLLGANLAIPCPSGMYSLPGATSCLTLLTVPPQPLPSLRTTLTNAPYMNGLYTITSSTATNTPLQNLFDGDITTGFISPSYYNSTSGAYDTTQGIAMTILNDGTGVMGEWIQIQVPTQFIVSQYVVSGFNCPYSNPTTTVAVNKPFELLFLGSADGVLWLPLDGQYRIDPNPGMTQTIFSIAKPVMEPLTFFRIVVEMIPSSLVYGQPDTVFAISELSLLGFQVPNSMIPPVAMSGASSSATTFTSNLYDYLYSPYNGAYTMTTSSIRSGDKLSNIFDINSKTKMSTNSDSTKAYIAGNGMYSGTTTTVLTDSSTRFGEWVQMKLPVPMSLKSYTMAGYKQSMTGRPSEIYVLGSNDGSKWVEVDHQNWLNTNLLTNTFTLGAPFVPAETAMNVLYDLYAAAGKQVTPTWNFTRTTGGSYMYDACDNNWLGVTCSSVNSANYITGLNLTNLHIKGTIPSTIGGLSSLTTLDLRNNLMYGSLPTSIGNLNALKILSLGRNSFTGTLPSSISFLSSLQRLSVDSNRLTGPIPSGICQFTKSSQLFGSSNFRSIRVNSNSFSCYPACVKSIASYASYFVMDTSVESCAPDAPTGRPSGSPTRRPSSQPTRRPTGQPTSRPSTARPSGRPSGQPSHRPSRQPSGQPTSQPIRAPTAAPSKLPTPLPSALPTLQPSARPTLAAAASTPASMLHQYTFNNGTLADSASADNKLASTQGAGTVTYVTSAGRKAFTATGTSSLWIPSAAFFVGLTLLADGTKDTIASIEFFGVTATATGINAGTLLQIGNMYSSDKINLASIDSSAATANTMYASLNVLGTLCGMNLPGKFAQTYQHYVVSFGGTYVKFYINGVLALTISNYATGTANNFVPCCTTSSTCSASTVAYACYCPNGYAASAFSIAPIETPRLYPAKKGIEVGGSLDGTSTLGSISVDEVRIYVPEMPASQVLDDFTAGASQT